MHIRKPATLVLAVALACAVALGFASKTTLGVFSTWDADLINIEKVSQTGAGVYVAVLDSGLVPNWRDYFPVERISTKLGTGFDQSVTFKAGNADPCRVDNEIGPLRQTTWVGSTGSTHGTHVTSTIIGYNYRSNTDAAAGFPLPPIYVRGIAPDVTIIPVKVLADYQIPALPNCTDPGPSPAQNVVFGTEAMIAGGINYATDLALAGYRPMVINMSFSGDSLAPVEKAAIDRAIANGVIVVADAGNQGESGMAYPGAYAPVISAGSAGWIGEWLYPGKGPRYRMWWLQYPSAPLVPGSGDVPDPTNPEDIYVSNSSSRALPGQQLDVLAPGSWIRGPFPGGPGYSHLPWYSNGVGDLRSGHLNNFVYVGGSSMATSHVSSVSALLLQKNPNLTQAQVEDILKRTALPINPVGSRSIFDFDHPATITWDATCGDATPCDAVGAGLIQADLAIAGTP